VYIFDIYTCVVTCFCKINVFWSVCGHARARALPADSGHRHKFLPMAGSGRGCLHKILVADAGMQSPLSTRILPGDVGGHCFLRWGHCFYPLAFSSTSEKLVHIGRGTVVPISIAPFLKASNYHHGFDVSFRSCSLLVGAWLMHGGLQRRHAASPLDSRVVCNNAWLACSHLLLVGGSWVASEVRAVRSFASMLANVLCLCSTTSCAPRMPFVASRLASHLTDKFFRHRQQSSCPCLKNSWDYWVPSDRTLFYLGIHLLLVWD